MPLWGFLAHWRSKNPTARMSIKRYSFECTTRSSPLDIIDGSSKKKQDTALLYSDLQSQVSCDWERSKERNVISRGTTSTFWHVLRHLVRDCQTSVASKLLSIRATFLPSLFVCYRSADFQGRCALSVWIHCPGSDVDGRETTFWVWYTYDQFPSWAEVGLPILEKLDSTIFLDI